MRTHPAPSHNTRFVLMAIVVGLLFSCGISLHTLNESLFLGNNAEPAGATLPAFTENAASQEAESAQWQSITLEEGDTLQQIAVYFGISDATLQEILQNSAAADALANLRPGSNMSLLFTQDHTLVGLRYNGLDNNLELTYQDSQWSVAVAAKPFYQQLPKDVLQFYLAANSAQAKALKKLTWLGLNRIQQTIAQTASYPLQINMGFMHLNMSQFWQLQLAPILPSKQTDAASILSSLQATQTIIQLTTIDSIRTLEQGTQQIYLIYLSLLPVKPMDLTQYILRVTVNPVYLGWDFLNLEMQKFSSWQSPSILSEEPTVLTRVIHYIQIWQQIFILSAEHPLLLSYQPATSSQDLIRYFGLNNPTPVPAATKAIITTTPAIPTSIKPILPIPQPPQILFASSEQAKINPHLYQQLQTIFKGVVPVERFNMVYDGAGNILVATVTHHHQTVTAIRYTDSRGITGYYTPSGQALFKPFFLTAPVEYTRISDHFTAHRWHPILHIMRPHYGVDYAAPIGTPIHAIGSGQVSFAGWGNGYGKTVVIRHGNHYDSLYAHMSHIGYSVKPGQWVTQGQIIGYVGRTGLSTGAHLHFGLYLYGKAVNPEKILPQFTAPTAVAARDLPDFLAQTNHLLTQLAEAPHQGGNA